MAGIGGEGLILVSFSMSFSGSVYLVFLTIIVQFYLSDPLIYYAAALLLIILVSNKIKIKFQL